MAETVAGGAEALQKKPMAACYINVVSGLRHNKEALEKLLFLASKNLPLLYIPASKAGLTSPVTPAGSVVLDYAGVLVGLVLTQFKREGAPVIVTGMPPEGTFDMRTLVTSYCEPERTIAQAVSHFYGLPMFSIAGASESKGVDLQAFSFIQLALCDEIISWIKGFMKGFEVSDETPALDVIAEMGPDGQYLGTGHTKKHYRERWYPGLFERAD